mgnify:CR=1 FL=1
MIMKLYVVPTPIGNLEDITLRALNVLKSVKFIACEDTRRVQILLKHYNIEDKILLSYYHPKESIQIKKIISLLRKDEDVALVSDAGTPAISDPGFKLINTCIKEDIPVEVLPGPCALITALVGSGLPTHSFMFLGFAPRKSQESFYKEMFKTDVGSYILYESPQRILDTLNVISHIEPDITVVIARELTKMHEEYIRGNIKDVLEELKQRGNNLKGEIVLILSKENTLYKESI